jgi:CRP-like cAMP-binding protein
MRIRSIPHLDLVRRIPGLSGSTYRELAEVSSLIDRAYLLPGDLLTKEGSRDRQAFIVIQGQADVIIGGNRVAEVGPGDFVGEIGMLDHGPRTATVQANSPMQVFVIGPEAFGPLLSHGGVSQALVEQLSQRLRGADRKLVTI